MKQTLTFLALITSLLISCKNNYDTKNDGLTNTKQQDPAAHNHEEHSEHSTAVTLNNGQKWPANAETTEGIRKMSSLLEAFSKEPKVEDYNSLKIKLENEFDMILQKCTMTGEAHDQLHNFLLPMKEIIEKLSSNSADEQKEASGNLKTHLKEYDKYFQ